MKRLLWLDDIRDPMVGDWLVFSPLERPFEVHWVKTYDEFKKWIMEHDMPDGVCFDHDLSDFQAWKASCPENFNSAYEESLKLGKRDKWDEILAGEKTGMDCAKWMVDRVLDGHGLLPKWNIQSSNPAGADNIRGLLDNFKKHHPEKCA